MTFLFQITSRRTLIRSFLPFPSHFFLIAFLSFHYQFYFTGWSRHVWYPLAYSSTAHHVRRRESRLAYHFNFTQDPSQSFLCLIISVYSPFLRECIRISYWFPYPFQSWIAIWRLRHLQDLLYVLPSSSRPIDLPSYKLRCSCSTNLTHFLNIVDDTTCDIITRHHHRVQYFLFSSVGFAQTVVHPATSHFNQS